MGALDLLWHLLNLFAPALGMAVVAPSLAKLVWRRELAAACWRDLAAWVGGVDAAVLVLGLVIEGRDGRMTTYGALVLATAATLWWRGWRHPPGRQRGA